jgi:hypothetical protein
MQKCERAMTDCSATTNDRWQRVGVRRHGRLGRSAYRYTLHTDETVRDPMHVFKRLGARTAPARGGSQRRCLRARADVQIVRVQTLVGVLTRPDRGKVVLRKVDSRREHERSAPPRQDEWRSRGDVDPGCAFRSAAASVETAQLLIQLAPRATIGSAGASECPNMLATSGASGVNRISTTAHNEILPNGPARTGTAPSA